MALLLICIARPLLHGRRDARPRGKDLGCLCRSVHCCHAVATSRRTLQRRENATGSDGPDIALYRYRCRTWRRGVIIEMECSCSPKGPAYMYNTLGGKASHAQHRGSNKRECCHNDQPQPCIGLPIRSDCIITP